MSRGAVAITRLVKRYGPQVAVAGVSLAIEPGELVALLGPSGCGKTTILRSTAGLVTPDEGDIQIDGRSVLPIPAHRRDLGMVFQSYALFPHMSVAENVAFGLRMRRISREEAARRVTHALGLVQMTGYENREPRQLSGGQQQRVALARALVTEPTVLLLDEPLAALDAKLREAMQIELRQLQRRLGITTVFVTHDQSEALGMADRIAVMSVGQIEQIGTAEAIYDAPTTPFVADFIGLMNKLQGRVGARSGARCDVEVAGGRIAAADDGLEAGASVVAMIRPERLFFDESGTKARVTEAVFSGDRITYHLESELGPLILVASNAGRRAVRGETVSVSWRAEDVILFRHQG